MLKQHTISVSSLFVAILVFQVLLKCQALVRTYSYESKYASSFMQIDTSGGKVLINPVDKDLDTSDNSFIIKPSRISETSGSYLALSTKEFSIKHTKTYAGVPADSVTINSGIQSGTISITYTLLHAEAKNSVLSRRGDLIVDIEVRDWEFSTTGPSNSVLNISLTVEAKKGVFQKEISKTLNTSPTMWTNTEVPVQLYSATDCTLDGIKADMTVTSVNTTSQEIKYTFQTPKFDKNSTYTAIFFDFARSMPRSSAQHIAVTPFLMILQATFLAHFLMWDVEM